MFEYLKEYDEILVTGPQRSGTTICARMIAHDTGHTYIDEARFKIWYGDEALKVARENRPCVVQGPGLLEWAFRFDTVVVMIRDPIDIGESLKRSPEVVSRLTTEYPMSHYFGNPHRILPLLMYEVFFQCTARKIQNLIEVQYDSLEDHPLWIPKEERVGWKRRQWKN